VLDIDRPRDARDSLSAQLEDRVWRLAAFTGHRTGRERIEREVDELEQAVAAVDSGWDWLSGMSAPNAPPRLAAVLPGVDWRDAKPLPYLLVRIPELEKERAEVVKRSKGV